MKGLKGGFTEKGTRDPTSYVNARTQLKAAVYEHYRFEFLPRKGDLMSYNLMHSGLEMLHHYRVSALNPFDCLALYTG
jgi:hypothetical protein